MKKFFEKINIMKNMLILKAETACSAMSDRLIETDGASEHTDKAVWIIGGIVLGVVIIGALVFVFKDTLIPAITNAINNIFTIG